jgi:hypothetical protein
MALITSTNSALMIFLIIWTSKGWAADIEKANLKWTNDASANFLNYEWKDPETEGETYFNSMLKSLMSYEDESFKVKLGAIGLRSFGDEKKAGKVEPWVQIALNFDKNVHFIMGTLETDHKAHEALLAKQRLFDDLTEEGFQIRFLGTIIRSDFWLNWHKRETQNEAEQFEVGSTNSLTTSYVDLDLQFIAHHIDGQKTKDTTSLRNNIASIGGSLKLPTTIEPRLGGRLLSSSYKLNDASSANGVMREMFLGVNMPLSKDRLITAQISSVKGHDFKSIYGLKPYGLDEYDFLEVSYSQEFSVSQEASRYATFGFRARAERFANESHSTQEMTLAVHF